MSHSKMAGIHYAEPTGGWFASSHPTPHTCKGSGIILRAHCDVWLGIQHWQ